MPTGWRDPRPEDKRPIRMGSDGASSPAPGSMTRSLLIVGLLLLGLGIVGVVGYAIIQNLIGLNEHEVRLGEFRRELDRYHESLLKVSLGLDSVSKDLSGIQSEMEAIQKLQSTVPSTTNLAKRISALELSFEKLKALEESLEKLKARVDDIQSKSQSDPVPGDSQPKTPMPRNPVNPDVGSSEI